MSTWRTIKRRAGDDGSKNGVRVTAPNTRRHYAGALDRLPVARPSSASISAHPAEDPDCPRPKELVGRSFVKIQAIVMAVGLALVATHAFADPLQPRSGGGLTAAKINGIVRSMGLMPASQPVRQGHTYAVLATNRRGKSIRVIVDARVGKVLSIQQAIAVIPPGPYPVRQPADAAVPRPYAPDEIRTPQPPRPIGETQPPALKSDKPEQKSTATPARPNAPVVTMGASSNNPVAEPKPTARTSGWPSFPPVQSFE
jgi:hypothetical protein